MAPKMFGEVRIAEVPSTDPAHLIGRNLEVSVAEITNQLKPHMKVIFKINSVTGKKSYSVFNGFELTRDYMYRLVRKRTSKLEIINEVETKDGWKLQITTITILTRRADKEIRKSVRKYAEGFLKDFASKAEIGDFVTAIIEEAVQQHIKKYGSRIYPIRFNEISKIEVIKTGKT